MRKGEKHDKYDAFYLTRQNRTIQGVGLVLLTMNAMCMVVMAMGALIGAVFGS